MLCMIGETTILGLAVEKYHVGPILYGELCTPRPRKMLRFIWNTYVIFVNVPDHTRRLMTWQIGILETAEVSQTENCTL